MRLSELTGKEIINLTDASRLGIVKEAQALIDIDAGRVEAFLVPYSDPRKVIAQRQRVLAVPWRAIKRFGKDLVIIEIKTPSPDDRHGQAPLRGEM